MEQKTKRKWLAIIQKQQQSGLKAAQFCRNENIGEKYFSKIKNELKIEYSNKPQAFTKVNVITDSKHKESEIMSCVYKNSTLKFDQLPDPKWLSLLLSTLSWWNSLM